MYFSRSVTCAVVVVMWCYCINTMALPVSPKYTIELRDAKSEEIALATTGAAFKTSSLPAKPPSSLLLQPAETSSNDEDTWKDVDFLEYLRDMMAMFCPTKEGDDRTCKENNPIVNGVEFIDVVSLWGQWRRLTGTKVEDTEVKCGQLVNQTNRENVACVLYVYDSKTVLASPKPPSNHVI